MRFLIYGLLSIIVAAFMFLSNLFQRGNFFSACLQISDSGLSVLVLLNAAFVFVWYFSKGLRYLLFGPLRPLEVERLYERMWFALTESFVAMTVFRDEFNIRFILLFALLLGMKMFHWLAGDRIDAMEQAENLDRAFHWRAIGILSVLLALDVSLVSYATSHVYANGPSMSLMFGFEYIILLTALLGTIVKYVLYSISQQQRNPWENLSSHILLVDLIVDFCKLINYSAFFVIVVHFYGPPIHLIRDLYITLHSFMQKFKTFFQFRRATADMETRYPTATTEQLATTDRTCIICRDEMLAPDEMPLSNTPLEIQRQSPKVLLCGHIFHAQCLRSWLQRQQSCPTCRTSVFAPSASSAAQHPTQQEPQNARYNNARPHAPAVNNSNPAPQPISQNGRSENEQNSFNIPANIGSQSFLAVPLFDVNNPPKPNSTLEEKLKTLTDSDLAKLEGDTREAMIARLVQLISIQEHLTDIITQLSQIASLSGSTMASNSQAPNFVNDDSKGKTKLSEHSV